MAVSRKFDSSTPLTASVRKASAFPAFTAPTINPTVVKVTINRQNNVKKLFVIEDLAAWNPNLRSKAAIRTSDTRHFVDPSIGTAALGLGPKDLMNDLDTFGLFFEDMAVRDLRVYAEALDGRLYHYRDSNGLECDTVIHRRNGSYALLEIKLGGENNINAGAASLIELAGNIDTDKMPSPSFMAVIIGVGQYAYQRKDGVYVIPIGCLKD